MTHIPICPRCSSVNVFPDTSKDMIAWGGSTNLECGDCRYSSSFFPEVPVENLHKIGLKKRTHRNLKEIMSTKGIRMGKPWGWVMVISAVLILLASLASLEWLIIAGPYSFLQLVIGVILIRRAK